MTTSKTLTENHKWTKVRIGKEHNVLLYVVYPYTWIHDGYQISDHRDQCSECQMEN